jgi:hypothetical protein
MAGTSVKYLLRLPAAVWSRASEAAEREMMPLSVWIRQAIREKLEREAGS